MKAQMDIFGFEKPRAKRLVRAHIFDAGAGTTKAHMGRFKCRCDWQSEWLEFDTISEGKKGIPCPKCNQ